jgi:hypothetical protein
MACWTRRYRLGDIQPTEDPENYLEGLDEGTVVLPLYLYDHSGLSMSTSEFGCRWDSGQVGFIYATPTRIKQEFGAFNDETLENAKRALQNEVETYNQYLTGDVWGYEIYENKTCECCNHTTKEHIDSCWGFFGDDALEAMRDHIDDELHEKLQEAWDNR